ncbi:centromere protein H (CENP-H)-domain-containing protein [Yarrowia lipolytica]|jgi:hypothetical protein|uniref:YALI0B16764p n=2 Tax=Yarrowia lipolytica TaxID=4952 RepID=Q6CEC4_YARLI|nr:YALI0B16764p [Yarrowia lipolytica CLIB122]AOW01807.1 hypothetical protein YALI1_B21816g [Yarrowia lipolytica]KAB8285045.1 centromere protein H (CENP-H)-domain-containing protein [Yarrowia lipolytica]KAE8175031.1 centromere protein H (CENP-H)-domain-containing protein [Yarrowia lipolytica]KAJ8052600.1 centromere protein H (CENP-H)-domain-containing protein [Yarrowia lipolytica]QNP97094.1 Hypothetical protein YALI2_C00747g [Yarrowia lipolytica]|eukprot:XP_500988.1 YALI0B16764p [Yarrowia lipolytica CLIB122]
MNLTQSSLDTISAISKHETSIPQLEKLTYRVLNETDATILEKLDLYESLALERAVKESDVSDLPEDLREANIETLKSRVKELETRLNVQRRVTRDSIASSSILNAIHHGRETTFHESSLLPLLALRDEKSRDLLDSLIVVTGLRKQLDVLICENRASLDTQRSIVRSIEKANDKSADRHQNNQAISELEAKLHNTKNKRRVLAEIFTALITASGIDWCEDEDLVQLIVGAGELNR